MIYCSLQVIWVWFIKLNNFSKIFEIKNINDASYVVDINIQRDRYQRLLNLSKKTCIIKIIGSIRVNKNIKS